jgi:hypothetical protein
MTIPAGQTASQEAVCPEGTAVIAGGYRYSGGVDVRITESRWGWTETSSGIPDKWIVTAHNAGQADASVSVYAVCTEPTVVYVPEAAGAVPVRQSVNK